MRRSIQNGINLAHAMHDGLNSIKELRRNNVTIASIIDKLAKEAIYKHCHDSDYVRPDSWSTRKYSVKSLDGETTECHIRHNWIKRGDIVEQYDLFLMSDSFKDFCGNACRVYPDKFHESNSPTISLKKFRSSVCKCVTPWTEASCVDVREDKVLMTVLPLQNFCEQNKLSEEFISCACLRCAEASLPKWSDVFNYSTKKILREIMEHCLCPPQERHDLTLPSDQHVFRLYSYECLHCLCHNCGVDKETSCFFPWKCPILSENETIVDCMVWARTSDNDRQLVPAKKSVKDLTADFNIFLIEYFKHYYHLTILTRFRKIDVATFPLNTLLVCTDFSAQMDLKPIRTDNCHVNAHASLQIVYTLLNRRSIRIDTGELVTYNDTHIWYCFGSCEERGKKNDWIFHNAVLHYVIRYYVNKYSFINTVRIHTDNCPSQFKW